MHSVGTELIHKTSTNAEEERVAICQHNDIPSGSVVGGNVGKYGFKRCGYGNLDSGMIFKHDQLTLATHKHLGTVYDTRVQVGQSFRIHSQTDNLNRHMHFPLLAKELAG
jgi:hypothetical protein